MPSKEIGTKTFCFTVNNYTEEDIKLFENTDCTYLCIGKEIAPTTKTPHLQGVITFAKTMRLGAVKKIHGTAHWEPAKARQDVAAKYCKKDGDFIEVDKRKQGKRTDLKALACEVRTNGIKKAIDLYPDMYIKFHNGIEKYAARCATDRNFKPYVVWLWGESGTGKTRSVTEVENDLWISGKNLKWWQGYEGQTATLFDDFREDCCSFHELIRIIDRYPYTVEFKGGSRPLNSQRMYITSCYHPTEVYAKLTEDITQLIRRIDIVIKCLPRVTYVNELEDLEALASCNRGVTEVE